MKTEDGTIIVPVEVDVSGFRESMSDLQQQTKRFGSVFSNTIRSAIQGGRSFEDLLKQLALRLSSMALSSSLKPLESATSNLLQTLAGNLTSSIGSAFGTQSTPSSVTPFAKGGVVASPTYFHSAGAAGLMGESGAEAILPLSRGTDGRLGVRAQNTPAPVNVVINISTPDVASFRKSEGRLSALLARSVSRGHRSL